MKLSPERFRANLLGWFQPELRQMPWRESKDPYQIWVSEIMLQQTQVNTVKPYFKRFLEAFPTLEALAQSPSEKVLKLWEGLGYYSRARNLQKGAQFVLAEFAGEMPSRVEDLLKIPGVGPYTAGAIASIAFDICEPAIDGNVNRVFSRLYAYADPIDKPPAQRWLDQQVRILLDPVRPGDFNQALMELGATVCKPVNPLCQDCPLHTGCLAKIQADPEQFPIKSSKTKIKRLDLQVALIRYQGKYLLRQQRESGIFHQLWVLPWESDLSRLETLILNETGLQIAEPQAIGTVSHTLTHRQLEMQIWAIPELGKRTFPDLPGHWSWHDPCQNQAQAIPVAHQKIFKFLKEMPLFFS
ncbi:A/G-specific adenine glycosylase [bacterium (Candidatus Blackallbacteria) CG17_big_fil_post_rev_8_21_14_2_50_48_46]|uniref:Adenine DNA glycosylase n=1 Tax=bacterium (Candidatus Blackallbacteria) CG17_big_fil_post_rev_8_21_14_2_50_48_46 TaxID=2014261 RepID=A0A2M7G3C8_9BACT|nr:MAG: A/G-specific adenine glycosylase [bacterium (Candidatus Blackallbacteria) CG18_big_fil_WC_8_21_14_2_50_49_26]PIW16342.1 MAG: A/G-specific adenine glycosylase [bacterium (Candidatus Blackallbacteria) CG17_big_fil_post_rev_8_21_14_2_50_48_46]PIW45356.1 MAG: A/G-specific adenine glycosylase [bacterium (Candidatus Blackallbacteria) CG13_big_fil_rev_8_21_14_2_50_49_14]